MIPRLEIELTPQARQVVSRFKVLPRAVMMAIKKGMDEQNTLTVSHIVQRYLSYPKDGPSMPDGLRTQSGSLRRSLRATAATITGNSVTSSIGGFVTHKGVNYLAVHELGATIPAHTIFAPPGGALRFVVGGKVYYRKSVKHPGATLPAREPIQRGIRDKLPAYKSIISRNIIAAAEGAA